MTTHQVADPALDVFDDVDLDELRRRRSMKWRVYPPDVLPAWVAEMDFPLAEPITATVRAAVDRGDCGYAEVGELAGAFAGYAAERCGWDVDPAGVFAFPDVMSGVADLLRLVTRPGDGVVINPPVYAPFFSVVEDVERRLVEVPLERRGDDWRLDLAGLEAAFAAGARAHLLCNPHNPTGSVLHRSELEALAELADRYGVTVLSDEIHAPLTLPGATHTPYVALGGVAAERGVTLASASKAWNVAGLKCAVVVAGSDAMRAKLSTLPEETPYRCGHLGVLAAVAAFREGGGWLDGLLRRLDDNRRLLSDLLAAHLPDVDYLPPQAGYLAWLDCTGLGLGADPAARFLERGRVALSPGPTFGGPGAGFARLNMGTSPALLEEAVRRMAAAIS